MKKVESQLEIQGTQLSLKDIVCVSRYGQRVLLSKNHEFLARVERSRNILDQALASGKVVYGVNTNFGGLANHLLNVDQTGYLQENLIWGLKCSIGQPLPNEFVRAAMLIRANTLARGVSGVRTELIKRLLLFLNRGITPVVRNLGSIGASGDLVPLAQIAGSIIGLGPGYQVDWQGKTMDAQVALKQLGLSPLPLKAKEGLALVNGTAMLTAMAVHCIHDARLMLDLAIGLHGFYIQALQGLRDSFDPFVHALKAHPGQVKVARRMFALLEGSQLSADQESIQADLVQDRYSVRCLAQYLGPIADGLQQIAEQVTTEMNSVDDNPLIDSDQERILQNGNFLGQYIGIGMDQLRYYMALIAKHMDVQVALLVSPEFNRGLPGCLAFDDGSSVKFGLKGLQICGNSILPRLLHLGQSIVPFFPTHAEQFNQNINSQGFNSAVLACDSLELMRYYLAVASLFAVQAVEQRSFCRMKSYLATEVLSPALVPLYETIYQVLQRKASPSRPLVSRNADQHLDTLVQSIYRDLKDPHSRLLGYVYPAFESEGRTGDEGR